MPDDSNALSHGGAPDVSVTERRVRLHTPDDEAIPASDPSSTARTVYREAFNRELERLPDIRDRLYDLAERSGYGEDVTAAIAAVTDAAEEIADTVEAEDPASLRPAP